MIISMTGYGRNQIETTDYILDIEVKTLNSKYLDTQIKLPNSFAYRELEIKQMMADILERGKINFTLNFVDKNIIKNEAIIDEVLLKKYFDNLTQLNQRLNDTQNPNLFQLALGMPDVIRTNEKVHDYSEIWGDIKTAIQKTIEECLDYRKKEGKTLEDKFFQYSAHIQDCLEQVVKLDIIRHDTLTNRLHAKIKDLKDVALDENRFELELIYYIEKMDIAEEKVRLKSHLEFFDDIMKEGQSKGKKLNFIAQEIGREINTIGSKAHDADIQHQVVMMKETLEKIKEQLLNIV